MFRVLLFSLTAVSFSVAAANNDDGFVWIDANTKIKLKPTGSNAGNAAAGGTNAPEPKKDKKEKPKK